MIRSNLPKTPFEKVKLNPALNIIVKTVFFLASMFGFWKKARKKASANFEDMSLIDKIFWGYKSQYPIILPEKNLNRKDFLKEEFLEFPIPSNFLKKGKIRINAAGDLYKTEKLEISKGQLYRSVCKYLFEGDISFANLESQLTNTEISKIEFNTKTGPPICCSEQQFETLKGHDQDKFTILNTACNHSMDMGEEGLKITNDKLLKEGIINLGTQIDSNSQNKGRVVETKGFRVGFISATYGLNGKTTPNGKEYYVNLVCLHNHPKPNLSLLKNQIEDCKEKKCDIIIASLHWGYEYEFFPRNEQVKIAHELIEDGVDVILGHHPHVVQPIELYRPNRYPNKNAIIAYSLGNLTNPFSAPHLALSHILDITFARGAYNCKEVVLIESINVIPVVQVERKVSGKLVVQIESLEHIEKRCKNINDNHTKLYVDQLKKYNQIVFRES